MNIKMIDDVERNMHQINEKHIETRRDQQCEENKLQTCDRYGLVSIS